MAVNARSYTTVSLVQIMIGDVVEARTFTATTVPSLEQVEQVIDFTAADLNRELAAAQYTVPVSTGDVDTRLWLQGINGYGAAAQIIRTVPSVAITLDQEDAANNRAQSYQRLFDRALQQIRDEKLAASKSVTVLGQVFSGSQSDSNGDRKLPFFTRGEDNNPRTGKRLTE